MAANPYSPPSAKVSDVASDSDEMQEIKLWSAKGRIGRLRYLAYTFGAGMIVACLGGLSMALLGPVVGAAIYALLYIPLLVFTIFAGIKRAHDMNWSGWTLLIPFVPAMGLGAVAASIDPANPNMGALGVVALVGVVLSLSGLIWIFKRGTQGPNNYGAPPPPNTTGVKVLAWIVPVVAILGILAAIALPAYQQYVRRAQEAQQGQ